MPTGKKFAVNISLVKELLAQQFPQWQHLSIYPVKKPGWDHFTFHLGPDMVIRLPSAKGYVTQVLKEYEWLPKLGLNKLSLTIPTPIALGKPARHFPHHWLISRWIVGDTGTEHLSSLNLEALALQLADFIKALHHINPTGGPRPSQANFYRGGDLKIYNDETLALLHDPALGCNITQGLKTWEAALSSKWEKSPLWVHGDISLGNLLFTQKRLSAVIDWGLSCVGDPACDLMVTWSLFKGKSREIFQRRLAFDSHTWARAKGWWLWKSLVEKKKKALKNA